MAAWLQRTAFHKKLNPIATFLVSSRTGMGCYFSVCDCCVPFSVSLTCLLVGKPNLQSRQNFLTSLLQGWEWQTS